MTRYLVSTRSRGSATRSGTRRGAGSSAPRNVTTSRSPNPAGGTCRRAARTARA